MTTDTARARRRSAPDLPFVVSPMTEIDTANEITDYETLVNHLHQAAQVELSTIPLYLYPAYSIEARGHNQWDPGISAYRTIISVAIEEMLHLCLVRNLMIAIGAGDRITFYDKKFIPEYPSFMSHRVPLLPLHLEPCSPGLMDRVFMPLELPAKKDAPPQPHQYETLGQFYKAIEIGLKNVSADPAAELWKYAKQNADYQYDSAYWNHDGGGEPVVVTDLATARSALKIVTEQGEGADPKKATVPIDPLKPRPGLDELSHYAKFTRISKGIEVIGRIRDVPVDPKVRNFGGPAVILANLFNAAYCYTLAMLDKLYALPSNLEPLKQSPRYHLERTFIAAMGGLLYPIADLLMRTPACYAPDKDKTREMTPLPEFAAPTFEYYDFAAEQKKHGHATQKEHLIWLCEAAIVAFPELGGDNSVRWLLAKMPDVDRIPAKGPSHRPRH